MREYRCLESLDNGPLRCDLLRKHSGTHEASRKTTSGGVVFVWWATYENNHGEELLRLCY